MVSPQLEQILSELVSRIDGVIDFWTALCFVPEGQGFDVEGFVTANREILDRLVKQVAQCVRLSSKRENTDSAILEQMDKNLGLLIGAVLTISRHRISPLEDVRGATIQLAATHASLLASVRQLAARFGLQVAYLNGRTAEREGYYNRILGSLFQLTQESRSSESIPQSLQMPLSVFQEVAQGLQDAGMTSGARPHRENPGESQDREPT